MGRFGACVSVGIAAGVTLNGTVAVIAIVGLFVVWLLSAIHQRREYREPCLSLDPAVARPRQGPVRSLVVWAEVVALQVTGVFLIVVGWSVVVVMVAVAGLAPLIVLDSPRTEILVGIPAVVTLVTVYLTGFSALARTGRRLRVLAAAMANRARGRPFVLYLRSFADDRCMVASGGTDWWRLAEFFSFRARIAMDEVIARQLGRTWPVLSIAEPAAPRFYIPLGATRRRVSDDQWREFVLARMDEAALIVISIGSSDALLWEVGMATRNGHLGRLIMVMPPAGEEDARRRWDASTSAIVEVGGPVVSTAADPSSMILARISDTGRTQVLVVDRVDESAYAGAFGRLLGGASALNG